ncbi:unnamed protein product [Cylicocyclus nassatus]|uniref:Aftiphilin clathrin-binding box domain-containing protein n=1 Tax=Cylicocyclus nassatus TaxID=53992 RepID=A0AA36GGH6_CYLNA|nr:unnamed protein product [Cylicocyclus nassatus]
MDFEAPPPFTGALDEPPDVELDARLTVDDDDEVASQADIPIDLPCSSSPPSLPPVISVAKRKSPEPKSPTPPPQVSKDNPLPEVNGIIENGDSQAPNDDNLEVNDLRQSISPTTDSKESSEESREAVESATSYVPPTEDQSHSREVVEETDSNVGHVSQDQEKGSPVAINKAKKKTILMILAILLVLMETQRGMGMVDSHAEPMEKVERAGFEWNAFERNDDEENQVQTENTNQSDGWNAFDQSNAAEDNDWPADFQDAAVVQDSKNGDQFGFDENTSSLCPVLDELFDSLDLWNVESEIGGDEAHDLNAVLDADEPPKAESDSSPDLISTRRSFDLWFALRIVEDALALKFEWKGSEHGENLYKALRVDPKIAGRGSLPPLSTSTVLEPTPFTANGTTRRSVIISREEGARDAKVRASDAPSKPSQPRTSPIVESPTIPQADFDWDKSGLTNPTNAANRSSALLDVDYFSANSGTNMSTISTLQKELDQLGLLNSSTQSLKKPANQPSVLDVLMASKSEGKASRPPSELSLDARALHDQLPDIEFLRANMIMFPLGGTRCDHR